jgi:hypothetical protein
VSSKIQKSRRTTQAAAPKARRPRVPVAVGGIQVNHCRMPSCVNFGIPARTGGVKAIKFYLSHAPMERLAHGPPLSISAQRAG